jgi:hypothetical protein
LHAGLFLFQVAKCRLQKDFYLLLKDNFDIYVLLKDGLLPIKTYGEDLEIFTTTNYFCVNKGLGKL